MKAAITPARRAYLKRRWLKMAPFYLGGLGLFALGCIASALVRLMHGAAAWIWVGIGAELAGAALMFVGIGRVLIWAKTARFEDTDGEGAA